MQNKPYVDEILLLQRSIHTKRHYQRYYFNILTYLNQFGDKFFLDYSFDELKGLILWIEQQTWSETEKMKHIAAMKKLRLKCEEKWLSHGKRYNSIDYDFLLNQRNILQRQFSDSPSHTVVKTHLTALEWKQLLTDVKEINPFHYVILRFFESACRIGGLVKTQVKNLNLEIGYFDTEEKSGKCRYFLPNNFLSDLKWYILRRNATKYLFFSNDSHKHYSEKGIRTILHRYTKVNPHDLRRSIMRWFDQAGASESDLCLLSNHKPSMNALYARINPFDDPISAKARYQLFYDKIFSHSK